MSSLSGGGGIESACKGGKAALLCKGGNLEDDVVVDSGGTLPFLWVWKGKEQISQ